MKIEIDFENKTIEADYTFSLGELIDKLEEMKINWREFKLLQRYISYPVYPQCPQPLTPYSPPFAPYPYPYWQITC